MKVCVLTDRIIARDLTRISNTLISNTDIYNKAWLFVAANYCRADMRVIVFGATRVVKR